MTECPEDEIQAIGDGQFRSLIDSAYDGLFLIDSESGQIKDANKTVCDWLGYSQKTVRDMAIFDCQTSFSKPTEWQAFVRKVREENGMQIENEIKTITDSTIPVEGSISVASIDGKEYVVAIPRKISDRG